ncbi:MAG: ABC transporter permease [Haloferacaceae archaeon]
MSWQAVARKDFEDSVRSYWLWGLSAVFLLIVSGVAFIGGWIIGGDLTGNDVIGFINRSIVTTLVPLIAMVVSYASIVGERESGSLKILLSLPHSRADVVVGKVIGRSGAMAVPILVGFLLPAIAFLLTPTPLDLGRYVGFTLLVIVIAIEFVAISVGFSAAASTQRRAIAGVIGFYFLFVALWGSIQMPLQFFVLGGYPESLQWIPLAPEDLVRTLRLLNPTGSFKIITDAFLAGGLYEAANRSLHVSATLMVVLWIVAPPVLGLLQFQKRDL